MLNISINICAPGLVSKSLPSGCIACRIVCMQSTMEMDTYIREQAGQARTQRQLVHLFNACAGGRNLLPACIFFSALHHLPRV